MADLTAAEAAQAAAAAAAALDACKQYMRVDSEEDDDMILLLMQAAKEYLANAGIPEQASSLYTMAVQSLTLYYYDHRDAVGTENPLPAGLRPVLNQLKLINGAL